MCGYDVNESTGNCDPEIYGNIGMGYIARQQKFKISQIGVVAGE